MNKPKWWRKLQYHRHQKRRITSGLVYHKHCNQVIVSKQELYIQLRESWVNENLLACLAFGPSHPRYAYWLLMASIKFWFIGSLSYPLHSSRGKAHTARGATVQRGKYSSRFPSFGRILTDEYDVAKLPRQYYERELFDSFLESEEEAQERLAQLARHYQETATITAENLFRKYTAVRNACLRMLTSTREFYFAYEYKSIIDYIATHEDVTLAFRSEYDDMPILPDGYQDGGEHGYYGDFYC